MELIALMRFVRYTFYFKLNCKLSICASLPWTLVTSIYDTKRETNSLKDVN